MRIIRDAFDTKFGERLAINIFHYSISIHALALTKQKKNMKLSNMNKKVYTKIQQQQ